MSRRDGERVSAHGLRPFETAGLGSRRQTSLSYPLRCGISAAAVGRSRCINVGFALILILVVLLLVGFGGNHRRRRSSGRSRRYSRSRSYRR
jgi:hypothetical protein